MKKLLFVLLAFGALTGCAAEGASGGEGALTAVFLEELQQLSASCCMSLAMPCRL